MKTTRNTVAKARILELIQASSCALSQPAIQTALSGLCDRVTIYRILDRLTEEGFIHRVVAVNGTVNYAACHQCKGQHQHRHIHFSCIKCQQITCLEQVEPSYQLPLGYQENDAYFMISGICTNCSVT
jgi:Fur family transcriptional regulator, ferric uptake regulator